MKNPAANIEVESTAALRVVEQISPLKGSAFSVLRRLSSLLPIADQYFSEVFQHNRPFSGIPHLHNNERPVVTVFQPVIAVIQQ
ncbi:hypothetical protein [Noviherbaspirillum sp.]|uniref:hypothetical protein n=1 Tax=Noviherbaspirillum sp. TaxID=1926288 RepID=UPI0025DB176F|nr:hypothetical protein [Noviherbaspirillum sp.]